MNQSEAIRAHIAANPGSTVASIRAALGMRADLVSNACKKMALRGILRSRPIPGVYNRCTYVTGRALLIDRTERARLANRNKAIARRSAAQQPTLGKSVLRSLLTDLVRRDTQVAYGATPDTDAWLAAGGHKEVLPANWQQPTRYPQMGYGFA